jgi:hypothetical protein
VEAVFELLVSADAIVPDYDTAIFRLQDEWGLPDVHPNWVSAPPGFGAKWCFARLQRDRRLAPTALEILAIPYHPPDPADRPPGYPFLPEIAASQGQRPARNHSTVVSAVDVMGAMARIHTAGGECRLDPPDGTLPFPRLWLGFSPDRPDEYRPGTDGGLRLELIPHQPLAMPSPDPAAHQPPLAPGAPMRIVARTILVDDLALTLATLETNLGWEPASVAAGHDGVRRARFPFAYPGSAILELAQPDDDSNPEGRFAAEWGSGPFSARIVVTGVTALRERFVARDVPHELLPPALPGEGSRLFRPADPILGTAFEFVEEDPEAS